MAGEMRGTSRVNHRLCIGARLALFCANLGIVLVGCTAMEGHAADGIIYEHQAARRGAQ